MLVQPIIVPNSPIMLIGEAPGKSEEMKGVPFVGTSGQELDQMLEAADISRAACSISNVFLARPPSNDLTAWMVSKKEGGVGTAIAKGKFFTPEHYAQRQRLYAEIALANPNIIIALGNTAAWALLDKTGIMAMRGSVAWSPATERKVLPTYHPAAVMREYAFRATTIMDLIKAKRESGSAALSIPKWRIIIEPTLTEIYNSVSWFSSPDELVAYDIETAHGQITCMGFATGRVSLTVPFVSSTEANKSYWPTAAHEAEAWKLCKIILESLSPKVTQNGMYDLQYLHKYNIRPRNSFHDTMLLHHSMMPEMPKSLGFLGSVYTNFPSWKDMRPRGNDTLKKDE